MSSPIRARLALSDTKRIVSAVQWRGPGIQDRFAGYGFIFGAAPMELRQDRNDPV